MYEEEREREWYVLRDGRIQGPYTENQVSRHMLLGRVRKSDRFSTDGQSWQSIDAVFKLIPEVLKNIQSDEGWRQYLQARSVANERGAPADRHFAGEDKHIERRLRDTDDLVDFRAEWQELLSGSPTLPVPPRHRALPLTLLFISVLAIGILLFFQ